MNVVTKGYRINMKKNKLSPIERLLKKSYSEMSPKELKKLQLFLCILTGFLFFIITLVFIESWTLASSLLAGFCFGISIYIFYPVMLAEKIGQPKLWEKRIFIIFRGFIPFMLLFEAFCYWFIYFNKGIPLYIPILYTALTLFFISVFWWGTRVLLKKCNNSTTNMKIFN